MGTLTFRAHRGVLGGPWVVISGVINRITVLITHIRGLITLIQGLILDRRAT